MKSMNKRGFVEELSKRTGKTTDECEKINDILESNFFISSGSKPQIVITLVEKLGIDEEESEKIYETAVMIVREEVKKKLIHPFGKQKRD